MHIVICDDLEADAKMTEEYLRKYCVQRNILQPQITIVCTGNELRKQKQIDILLLDIELDEESGIELAGEVNSTSPDTLIVFVSRYSFYVTDTYKVQTAQFLVKPLRQNIFEQVMDQVMLAYKKKQATYVRRCEGEPVMIRKDQVVFIESAKRILTAYLANGKGLSSYGTLNEEEQLLAEYAVVRCHKRYLVNLHYVKHLERDGITVEYSNGKKQQIPVGESMYQAVCAAHLQYICS